MNYIEQLNMFWLLDAEHLFNGNESRLYFYLLKLSNSLYWKNPLTNADGYTASVVGISVNTLKTARNRLQQAGLIQFKPGGKGSRDKCIYFIVPASNIVDKVSKSDTLLEKMLTPYLIPGLEKTDDISKHKPNQTKKEVVPDKPAPPKNSGLKKSSKEKIKEAEPYWDLLVKAWFDFNIEKFSDKPSFADADPRYMKKLIERLKKRAEQKKETWDQITGPQRLNKFLSAAYGDPWLAKHFLLKNLLEQFDAIILGQQSKHKATDGNGKPREEKKSLWDQINYLYGRFMEGQLDTSLVKGEYYDQLVTRNALPTGYMEGFEGTVEEKKVKAVLQFFRIQKEENVQPA